MRKKAKKKIKECSVSCKEHCGGAIYGLGFIGALIYYLSTATGFWVGVLGFIKAIIWPVFLVYEVLRFLGA